jgi:hypothetical protein
MVYLVSATSPTGVKPPRVFDYLYAHPMIKFVHIMLLSPVLCVRELLLRSCDIEASRSQKSSATRSITIVSHKGINNCSRTVCYSQQRRIVMSCVLAIDSWSKEPCFG